MSKRANPQLIGMFVVGSIAIAVTAVVVFGSGRLFSERYEFITFFDGSVSGLNSGAPVKFRGVEIGNVVDVRLAVPGLDQETDDFRLPVIYELDATRIVGRGASVPWDNPNVSDSLIDAGIRAELTLESLVTGRLFIALDFLPDSPVDTVVGSGSPFPQIPAYRRPGFADMQLEVTDLINTLGDLEYENLFQELTLAVQEIAGTFANPDLREAVAALPGTVNEINTTVASLGRLVERLDSTVVPIRSQFVETADEAAQTLDKVQQTLTSMQAVFEPGSPLLHELETTLRELSAASRSMQSMAESIERNPSAILRGKEQRGNNR